MITQPPQPLHGPVYDVEMITLTAKKLLKHMTDQIAVCHGHLDLALLDLTSKNGKDHIQISIKGLQRMQTMIRDLDDSVDGLIIRLEEVENHIKPN